MKEDGRTARARATKARILEAAMSLFVESGYAATSIGAIASKAGVGEQTVYYSFGNKRTILSAALDRAIAGDDEPVPTLERPWVRAALSTPDPVAQLQAQVDAASAIHLRVAPFLDVVRGAASTDPDLSDIWTTNVTQRLTVHRFFVDALLTKAQLRVTPDEAADTMLTLMSPETYNLLVHVRGWSHDRWRTWTLDALTRLLLS